MSPHVALVLVHRELGRIADMLISKRITKESAGSAFDVIETTLQGQVAGWTQRVSRAPRAQRHADMLELFTARANSTRQLRNMIVRLFEEADETVLQLN